MVPLATSAPTALAFLFGRLKWPVPMVRWCAAKQVRNLLNAVETRPAVTEMLLDRLERHLRCVGPVGDACSAEPRDLHNCQVFGGLDLSATDDLTCLVLAGLDPLDGTWSVLPIFWLPELGIAERSRRDRVQYDVWADQGWLELIPGAASVQYQYVAARVLDLIEEFRITKIGFDAWGFGHFKPWLLQAGMSEAAIKDKFVEMRQGFKTMSPALRDFESLVLERKIRHGGHPVLNMCAANATVTTDPAGNRKLDKARASGRIDGMVALAMALAAAPSAWTGKIDVETLIF